MWKRFALLAAAVAVSVPLSIVVAASPASAIPSCGSTGVAHWTTQSAYNFSRGGWCMTDGQFHEVVWQSDGNLVWYSLWDYGRVLWASGTCYSCTWAPSNKRGATRLSFQVDGNIVVYNASGKPLWAIGESNNRWDITQFYWKLNVGNSCGIRYDLTHYQISPSDILHSWSRC
jgi:hypothetical protein